MGPPRSKHAVVCWGNYRLKKINCHGLKRMKKEKQNKS